jgi:hypothetical protein
MRFHRVRHRLLRAVLSACAVAACVGTACTVRPTPATTGTSAELPAGGRAAADSVRRDSLERAARQRENDEEVAALLAGIGDQAGKPAGEVFENVQIPWLKTVPARTFLSIMSGGYARALGVRCAHCHDTDDFSSDDKRPKRAAREMAVMHRMINQELAKMQHIRTPATENRAINCSTCHRGTIDPRGAR